MFDFLRNLTKSAEEKRQERLTAYIDGSLSPAERQRFEELLAQDPGLQAELEQQQSVKRMLSQVPQRRVPRNFTLDPAQYGRPAKQPLVQYYPALRAATVLTAVMLFLAVGAGVITQSGDFQTAPVPAADIAMETAGDEEKLDAAEAAPAAEEEMVEEMEAPAEEEMSEEMVEEAPVAESAVEEAAEAELAEEPPLPEATAVSAFAVTREREGESGLDTAAGESETFTGQPESTPTPSATGVFPTPTQSSSPRIDATELANRLVTGESEATGEPLLDGDGAPAEEPVVGQSEVAAETAVQDELVDQPQIPDVITLLQIGLVILLVVLVSLTLYARRQLS